MDSISGSYAALTSFIINRPAQVLVCRKLLALSDGKICCNLPFSGCVLACLLKKIGWYGQLRAGNYAAGIKTDYPDLTFVFQFEEA